MSERRNLKPLLKRSPDRISTRTPRVEESPNKLDDNYLNKTEEKDDEDNTLKQSLNEISKHKKKRLPFYASFGDKKSFRSMS